MPKGEKRAQIIVGSKYRANFEVNKGISLFHRKRAQRDDPLGACATYLDANLSSVREYAAVTLETTPYADHPWRVDNPRQSQLASLDHI